MEKLSEKYPHHLEVPLLLSAAALSLGFGLVVPIITLRELVFWKHTFSVLTGIQSLYQEKYYFLALVIFVFSVIFPVGKLTALTVVWYLRISQAARLRLVGWLGVFGKWSMLDVFVAAVTIVITKVSGLIEAEPRPGIYIFAFSIILSMLATMRIEQLNKRLLQSLP
ncbi:MAG: paraquat-inducible protein A [Candidatus Omnitrophica bacterium]|nr:paraquat-inducible protein A [Candidatus Omnitrophota bacterium]